MKAWGLHIAIAVALVAAAPASAQEAVFEGPVDRATCGPGSQPEDPDGLQGEVTAEDRDSGRSVKPYSCNLEVVGNDRGRGTSWQHAWYGECAYYDTSFKSGYGVQVIDVSDSSRPNTVRALQTPAMLDPWESLSVADRRPDGRKLLAGVAVTNLMGPAIFDVYDVEKDCKNPQLLTSAPVSGLNHEGNWSHDGMTFWAAGTVSPTISAIDVTNPSAPAPLGTYNFQSHGLSTSWDGNRLYLAANSGPEGNGLSIVDVSAVQAREPLAQPSLISTVAWEDGAGAQHTVPVTFKGRPYVLFVDESGYGAARFIDISDETKPRVVSKLKLEIHMEKNQDRASETSSRGGTFGYDAHYCNVDTIEDPTIVVCSMFQSGLRVFDVRDPLHPREIAYYNPGGTGQLPPPGSNFGYLTPQAIVETGFPPARPRIIRERGEIWFTDQNKGFYVLRFSNGVWPFKDAATPKPSNLGLPSNRPCLKGRFVTVRVERPKRRALRSAVIYVNGERVKTVRGKAVRRRVRVALPKGHSIVSIVARSRSGKRYSQTKAYTRCA